MLQRHGTVPLYLQLARHLQGRIDSRDLPPGARLPSESELADRYAVNRLTVRQAVAELDRAGAVEIHRGIGTFVRTPPTQVSVDVSPRSQRIASGSPAAPADPTAPQPDPATARVERVLRTADTAEGEATRALGLPAGHVRRIDTLIDPGGSPLAVSSYWLAADLLPAVLPALEDTANLAAALHRVLGEPVRYAWRAFSATAADLTDAPLLGVPTGHPLLVREGVSCTADGTPVYFVRRRLRGDAVRFVLHYQD
ncbi:GntR family transcriptional regulator [Kitasatospora sp. NBC_01539]|uniref:GntR family transcriptional regulator n=1 Tax=Kitasatospora sp. NBC_01539 TaxID=2903577 RepID=UPI0038601735